MKQEHFLLEMKGISKRFTGVRALDNVNIHLKRSEILALLGENGAGKSTLMKILAGVHQPTSGDILIKGNKVQITGPKHSQELGISIIHQEFNLIPDLSIAENIFLGREPRKMKGIVDWKALYAETSELLKRVGLESLSPKRLIRSISVAEQQLVELAKALSFSADIIIMDEPTAALNHEDADRLLHIMSELKAKGFGVIFITHKLEEVQTVADRISVLRDGQYIGTKPIAQATKDDMIQMMVGRDIEALFPEKSKVQEETILTVNQLHVKDTLYNLSFSVKKGEIVGIAGLLGSGKTELSKALFGLYPKMQGEILMDSKVIKTPREAIDSGIALVTDDRKQEGLILDLSVWENLLLPVYREISRFGILPKEKQKSIVQRWIQDLKIKVPGPQAEVRKLSGGNQQKIVLGKWLQLNPKLLILNEPTRGIDIGAKVEIYNLMKQLAEDGLAIILISSEMPELLGMAHRILVMENGRMTAELSAEEATQEKIFFYASGGE